MYGLTATTPSVRTEAMNVTRGRSNRLRAGMVGMGMIFDETYRPMFEALHATGLYRRDFGMVEVMLAAAATRTGTRARANKRAAGAAIADFASFAGDGALEE